MSSFPTHPRKSTYSASIIDCSSNDLASMPARWNSRNNLLSLRFNVRGLATAVPCSLYSTPLCNINQTTFAIRCATAHAAPLPLSLGDNRANSPAKKVSLVRAAANTPPPIPGSPDTPPPTRRTVPHWETPRPSAQPASGDGCACGGNPNEAGELDTRRGRSELFRPNESRMDHEVRRAPSG